MPNPGPNKLLESCYRAYLWLCSIKPLGQLDWSMRRKLGIWFNQASSTQDMRLVRLLAARREQAGRALSLPASPKPRCESGALHVIVLPGAQTSRLPAFLLALDHQSFPAQEINLQVVVPDGPNGSPLPDLPTGFSSAEYRTYKPGGASLAINQAIEVYPSGFLLLVTDLRIPNPNCIADALAQAARSPLDTALWELSPTPAECARYIDPVTLEIACSELKFSLIRSSALLATGAFDTDEEPLGQAQLLSERIRASGKRLQACPTPLPFVLREGEPQARPPAATGRHSRLALAPPGAVYPPRQAEQKRVSIIIRSYRGRERWLRQSLSSALNQTYDNLEILVAEDGSDDFALLVDAVNTNSLRRACVTHLAQPNKGRSAAGNLALQACRGEYVVFLDDDDLLLPGHVELLHAAFCSGPKDTVAAYSLAWEAHTEVYTDNAYRERHLEVARHTRTAFDREKLGRHNFLPIQSVLFHRSLYETLGGFDEQRHYLEDWDLWLRYAQAGHFEYLPIISSIYRTPADPYQRIARVRHGYDQATGL